jgi:glycosyltransferase involved in cell wall biosynthesis
VSVRLAYLVGRYPAASHAFLLREVESLRGGGAEVETVTIRPPHADELRTEADREAARTTYRVLPAGPLKLLAAHLPAFFSHPRRYLRTLAYALRLGKGARGHLWQLFYFAESIVVWRHCRRLGLSHLHAHFADTATDSALLTTHFEPDSAWSISLHGPDEFAEAAENRLAEKLRSAELIVAVNGEARRGAIAAGGDRVAAKTSVVNLGVDLEKFSPPRVQAPDTRERLRVLCLGRLVERKGQAFLIAALERPGTTSLELTLAGDGPERRHLEALAERLQPDQRVTFTGVVGQDEALELYRDADLFCLPSLSEGMPAVLIEAMACGLPVVTTRIDAIPELVSDGANGLLVEPGNADALAAALTRLAGDPGLRARLGAAARETVGEHYEIKAQTARLLALFESSPAGQGLAGEAGGVGGLPDAEQGEP